jgi:hypothetical protein
VFQINKACCFLFGNFFLAALVVCVRFNNQPMAAKSLQDVRVTGLIDAKDSSVIKKKSVVNNNNKKKKQKKNNNKTHHHHSGGQSAPHFKNFTTCNRRRRTVMARRFAPPPPDASDKPQLLRHAAALKTLAINLNNDTKTTLNIDQFYRHIRDRFQGRILPSMMMRAAHIVCEPTRIDVPRWDLVSEFLGPIPLVAEQIIAALMDNKLDVLQSSFESIVIERVAKAYFEKLTPSERSFQLRNVDPKIIHTLNLPVL